MTFTISRVGPSSYEFRRKGAPLVIAISASSSDDAVLESLRTHGSRSNFYFTLGGRFF